jgi:hypothetical protein
VDKQTLKKPTNPSEAFCESNLEINNSHIKGGHMTTDNSQNETLTQATGIVAATSNTAPPDDSTAIAGDYVADEEAIKQQTSAMDAELNNMKQSAADVQKQYKLGNTAHYTHLVVMVLFWIQASKISGYLEKLYKSKLNKTFKTNVNHGTNFAPLLATVWKGIDCEVMTNKHNRNSRAMNAILNEYNENAEKYAVNTVDQLVAFVKDKGGINGLIDTGKQISIEKNTSDLEADMALCKSAATQDAEEIAKLSQEGLNYVQSSTSYPTASFTGNVILNKDNCSLVLINKTSSGKYAVISQITDTALINKSLAKQYGGNFGSCPKALRVIAETTATQCLPNSLQHTYKHLIEEAGKFDDGEKRHVARRLVYKSNQDEFLLSSVRTNSCVVTVAKPKQQVIEQVDYDLHLSSISRRALEKKIISPRLFKSYKLVDMADDEIFSAGGKFFSHEITLEAVSAAEDEAADRIQVIMDSELTYAESFCQVDVADMSDKNPLWKRTVNHQWIQEFNACFTNNWIESHGKHIKRSHQTILELEFKRRLVQVNFFKKGSEYDFDLMVKVPVKDGDGYGVPCNVLSKDFAVAMHALGDLPLINDVVIEVFVGALKFSYETDAATYELYVPFADEAAERNASAFTKYQLVRPCIDLEDDPSYQTEAEMAE